MSIELPADLNEITIDKETEQMLNQRKLDEELANSHVNFSELEINEENKQIIRNIVIYLRNGDLQMATIQKEKLNEQWPAERWSEVEFSEVLWRELGDDFIFNLEKSDEPEIRSVLNNFIREFNVSPDLLTKWISGRPDLKKKLLNLEIFKGKM